MLNTIADMQTLLQGRAKVTLSVAAAQEKSVLSAVYNAYKAGIADAILVGEADEIVSLLQEMTIDPSVFKIIDAPGGLE